MGTDPHIIKKLIFTILDFPAQIRYNPSIDDEDVMRNFVSSVIRKINPLPENRAVAVSA